MEEQKQPETKLDEERANDLSVSEKHELVETRSEYQSPSRTYWAIGGQVLFAIFLIIAFYAIGYEVKSIVMQYAGSIIPNAHIKLGDIKGFANIDSSFTSSYGLGISAIVFAFVGILIPCSSLLFRNKNDSKIINYSMLFFNVITLILAIASISIVIQDLTVGDGNALVAYIYNNYPGATALGNQSTLADTIKSVMGSLAYKGGYAAGMFIMTFAGYGIAVGGEVIAYKDYFKLM